MTPGFGVPLGEPVPPPGARGPDGRVLEGRFARLEKLDTEAHFAALWECARVEPADRWAYLADAGPFGKDDEAAFRDLVSANAASADPFFYAILRNGAAQGWASLMRHDIPNAVIEVGWIWLSKRLARSAASTEAMYLLMRHAFEDLRIRRYEWKSNALNAPSCAAAERLGFTFEGIHRQVKINRGRNRDTAWYSMLDREWPRAKTVFESWLDLENFDADGRQRRRLQDIRDGLRDG